MFGNTFNWGFNGWSGFAPRNTFTPSPFTSSWNSTASWFSGFSNDPRVPFGGSNQQLDRFDQGGIGNGGASVDIIRQADYVRRLQILQALGPGAAQRIPNWQTMPFNDFLIAAARLRQGGGVRPNPQQGQPLPVNVTAKSYWENGERIPVRRVNIWDLGANEQNSYNSVQQNDFNARFDRGIQGRRYRVTVEWENGRSYVWDHVNNGSNITIWQPNQ
jgi:hypothetical protein